MLVVGLFWTVAVVCAALLVRADSLFGVMNWVYRYQTEGRGSALFEYWFVRGFVRLTLLLIGLAALAGAISLSIQALR